MDPYATCIKESPGQSDQNNFCTLTESMYTAEYIDEQLWWRFYGTPEGTFPFQYLAEKKFGSMLFKRDLCVEKYIKKKKKKKKKRHNKLFKRHIMLFYFPFLVFCSMLRRKEKISIKYRMEIKNKTKQTNK